MSDPDIKTRLREIDEAIADLIARRLSLVQAHPDEARITVKPQALIERVKHLTGKPDTGLAAPALQGVFREVWSASAALIQPLSVAFLGPEATFTHQAAMTQFGGTATFLPQTTIGDVFEAVQAGRAAYGVVPVENSTEGSVTHTLDMFVDTDLKICAEMNMPIHHCLLCRCRKSEVQTVYSHPQVLGQCRTWLQRHMPDVQQMEVSSTTKAAARAADEANAAALAGHLAGQTYDLPVRAENIEDFHNNTTRFLMLGTETAERTGDDKTSLLLVVRDRVGALYDALLPFGRHGVNLTFIESRPSKRRNWEYYFFIDINGHVSEQPVIDTLDELEKHCQFIKILGSYPRAVNGG